MRGLGVRRGSCRFREPRDDQAEWEKAGSDWGNPTRPSLQNVLLHTASKLAAANLVDKSCETFKGNAKARIRALPLPSGSLWGNHFDSPPGGAGAPSVK